MPADPASALDLDRESAPLSPRRPPKARSANGDPDLIDLPAPPKRERRLAVVLMVVTALAATGMAVALFGEASYALSAGQPLDVGDLASLKPTSELKNRYIRATGLLGTSGAVRYGRAAESDSFRLAPIAGNPQVWVEIHVPEGFEGPRFVPPTNFAGRLVPFKSVGLRHRGLASSVDEQSDAAVPDNAWLLIDGASPRASRWAVALASIFLGFAAWNVVGVVRVLRRIKDRSAQNNDEEG